MREFNDGRTSYPDIFVFDVTQVGLPEDWHGQTIDLASRLSETVEIDGSHPSSREVRDELVIHEHIGGVALQKELPWLFDAYHGKLKLLARQAFGQEVTTNTDPRDVMDMLVNQPGQRGEAHVDNSPVSLLLYPQPAAVGGRLFVTPNTQTYGYKRIIRAGSPILPETDYGLILRGDRYAHVAESNFGHRPRVVLNMNYQLPGRSRDTSLREYLTATQK